MSTNLFTPEQESFLRGHNIDTSLPIFPLSCQIAAKTLYYGSRCFYCKDALDTRARGGYESEEEHKKNYLQDLFKYEYKACRKSAIIFGVIAGEIIALILLAVLWVALVTGHIKMTVPEHFTMIVHLSCMFLSYLLINKCFKRAFLKNRRQELEEEMAGFRREVNEYETNLKDADANYAKYTTLFEQFKILREIITENREALPQNYWGASEEILKIYNDRRANNVADAIRVFEETRHQHKMEIEQKKQTQLANQANITAQQALQTAKNAETTAGFAISTANYAADRAENRY